ncbi:D-alanine--D-alanyl carrier protein ligase [Lapidilactobacillus concavus DSM 17758]|uniref:D-alanine--D-alanyl carrier protein ligase n=1 Tax=Lapidilactobacillus concavus DSM 17758 TaxID=1423735 RepID=A0A0R1W9H8_9LACO|nr:D-alanine--poly(phosphoribitol) ligase subunit DltA [Lapidilactobacillus concavus]KRM12459.1 D-alanine--D-alanyl carrier protein ligase [Lapidilactobacillus concavus DSM 17758]GEL13294.1 D-alanine--poly(phosphoribitol) ligase subunit 1 [Lapidilactobacillus concavus]
MSQKNQKIQINNVIDAIDQISATQPDQIAYDYLGTTYTYRQLVQQANTLAFQLDALNLPAKSPIIVYGGQEFEMLVAFLAAVKTGHAYIPVDDHSDKKRLLMIQDTAHSPLVIAIDHLPVDLPDTQVISLEEINLLNITDEQPHFDAVNGDDNFYIIFTSGTTGKPKGVQISHNNLLSFVNWQLSDFQWPECPNVLAQAPFSFDLSVMGLYPTLTTGGTLKALPKEVTEDFKQLFHYLPQLQLNVWISTPSLVEICLLLKDFDAEHYPTLTHFLFCGEELSHPTAEKLSQRFPAAKIFNTYGPTETCVAVTGIEITPAILAKYSRLPIGRVKADTTITIKPQADEAVGEIMISGPSVSKGYLNLPEKTTAAFDDGQPWRTYHSGDLGFFADDDLLFYRGRMDFQIKFNGYRIELEEINFYLRQSQLIEQGVVVPRYNQEHRVNQLIAFIVPTESPVASENDLTKAIKQELQDNLMPYMIPQRFVYRESLPRSANDKVDIKALILEVNS